MRSQRNRCAQVLACSHRCALLDSDVHSSLLFSCSVHVADRGVFLANVMEELCGADAGKVRASARRGEDGSMDDAGTATSSSAPSFVLQRLCSHAKCSHLVQNILAVATPAQIGMFFTALGESIVDVLADRYGSHVVESVLFRLPKLLAEEDAAARNGEEESKADADKRMIRQRAKTEAAWKNVGTHSKGTVAQQSDAATLPLRAHFFTLVSHLGGSWLSLAQNAHASYLLRHLIHLLQGEEDIKALAVDSVPTPGAKHAAAAAAAAAVSAALSLPAYLLGLEELLPWIVQEVCAASSDDLEAASHNASGAPVLQSLAQAMAKLQRLALSPYGGGETSKSGLSAALQDQMRLLFARLLQFEGTDSDSWTPESQTVSSKNHVTVMLQDRSGSRLLETVCELGGVDVVSPLFECHMRGRLLDLATHFVSNFPVQHVLQAVRAEWGSRGRHLLRAAFDELSPHVAQLCKASRSGVVLKLLDACVRVQVKENKLFKLIVAAAAESLTAAAQPMEPTLSGNPVATLLLAPMLKAPSATPESIGVIGSLIVQSCMQPAHGLLSREALTAPTASPSSSAAASSAASAAASTAALSTSLPFTTVLNGFLSLPSEFLLRLAMDPAGSRVFEAYLRAPISLSLRQALLRKFQMKWVELAMSAPGSFVVERLFALAPPQLKVGIASDLCRVEKRVQGSRSGSALWRKLRLDHFKQHQPSWLSGEESRIRKSKLFEDIFGTDGSGEDKEKQRQAKKEQSKKDGAAAAAAGGTKDAGSKKKDKTTAEAAATTKETKSKTEKPAKIKAEPADAEAAASSSSADAASTTKKEKKQKKVKAELAEATAES